MANMASACALVVSEEKSFEPVRSWSTKTAATTCAFVSISVVCICVMVVCGVFVVREFALAESYKRNNCWVEDISFLEVKECNFCPSHKAKDKSSASCIQSKFPCVKIIVAYDTDETKQEGILHLTSIEASGLHHQCSHQVCMKDYEASKKAIESHLEKYKDLMVRHMSHHNDDQHDTIQQVLQYLLELKISDNDNQSQSSNSSKLRLLKMMKNKVRNASHHYDSSHGYFPCFVNEDDPHDVIEHKTYTRSDVIHCMLWPSLIIFVCCCLFLYIETSRRRLTFCGQRDRPGDHDNNFPGGRSFLPSGKVKVLDRSHFVTRGIDDHTNKLKENDAYIKKVQPNKTYPVKTRLLQDNRTIEELEEETRRNKNSNQSEIDAKISRLHAGTKT